MIGSVGITSAFNEDNKTDSETSPQIASNGYEYPVDDGVRE